MAVVESLLGRLGVSHERVVSSDDPVLHPGRAARIVAGGVDLGTVGELHPGLAATLELAGPVALAELDLARLEACLPGVLSFTGLSAFPPVRQDIVVAVSAGVAAASLVATARAAAGDLLDEIGVFDVFADAERLGEDRLSIGLRLTFQAPDRTLTEAEASAVRQQIVAALAAAHGAELR